MIAIEASVVAWSRGCSRAVVVAAVEAAWRDGAPTIESLEYARRRIRHHGGGAS